MVKLRKSKSAASHNGKGNLVLPAPQGKNLINKSLKDRPRVRQLKIASTDYVESDDDATDSWADMEQKVEGTEWMIPYYLPYGELIGIIGEPKKGKSFLALATVQRVITGVDWFTGKRVAEPANVVWCDTEKRAKINLGRAKKWGLDMSRIKLPFKGEPFRAIDLDNKEHIDRLFNVVCRYKCELVVVDSFRGSHRGEENSSKIVVPMQNLADIGAETNAAVTLVHHTKKMHEGEEIVANSGRGSNTFLQMVSSQLVVDQPNPKSKWRRLQVLGENLGVAPKERGFLITNDGLKFGDAPKPPKKKSRQDEARTWLLVNMEPGKDYDASEIISRGVDAGHSMRMLQRASNNLVNKETVRNSKNVITGHKWTLPPQNSPT